MGGGAVWSRVVRLATSMPPAVRTAPSAASSCSFCKFNASLPTSRQASSSQAHACPCSPETTPRAVSLTHPAKSMWDSDEWEFAEDEEKIDHLVFGPLPTKQEVEDASADLQDALRLGLLAPSVDDRGAPCWDALLPPEAGTSETRQLSSQSSGVSVVAEETKEPDWIEPPSLSRDQNVLTSRGRSSTQEVLSLYSRNPEVKAMVHSIATDPNVWDAVLANPEIQEFRRKLQGTSAPFAQKSSGSEDGKGLDSSRQSNDESQLNIIERIVKFWEVKFGQFKGALNEFLSTFFSFSDKKMEFDEVPVNGTVKVATGLALVLLFVVILKRLP